ncbi:acyl-CoA dehydrogenase [Desulfobotulus alkaliphilus]|uniref:Acyl-CoA dehydrogenase n=1 Tax=Desulfobotulus alkaliphilus TaxID=622671 RepID=A0A562S3G8_9BACT|nr:acyl-CoA dehydrogenase family protein [Desulfobotulus alkaliphilus]TWI75304.1 acyl-CoA dehydrogenase [Desulfobotulus alkaliphilus]
MILFNPKLHNRKHADEKTQKMMQAVIDYFETKGLKSIKKDWHDKTWNYEFVKFMKDNQVMATLMTPAGYGAEDSRWDTYRNSVFAEISAFYGITYWYTYQVSMLGLGPIWMGSNEEIKHKTAKLLQDGEVFAFGLSEKEHGADIYSSDMMLYPQEDGTYKANGDKYYIGNGNECAIASTFGKVAGTDDYVFFAANSKHPQYECVKNTVNEQNYVAEYVLHDYPITDADIMERGPKAWDNMLNTINVCKFNLGWGAIGMATHSFYEAIDHAANRNVYGKYVTDFPHVKRLFTDSYTRLVAMKVFSERAIDYMRSAKADDRRYLLYNPMVKMKVTTQGEEVINMLWDIIAAKGFEAEPFFEIAAHEIRMLPKLEGTVHVNMALIVKFMNNFLFNPAEFPKVPKRDDVANDDFLFDQGPTAGLSKVQFHDYNLAYKNVDLPNVNVFKEQIESFKKYLVEATPDKAQARDIDYLLVLGEIFCLVPYGQLILEAREFWPELDDDLIEEIFDFMIRDFSRHATTLFTKPSNTDKQREMALAMIKAPAANPERFNKIWTEQVYSLKGQYKMRDQD